MTVSQKLLHELALELDVKETALTSIVYALAKARNTAMDDDCALQSRFDHAIVRAQLDPFNM